MITVPGQSLNFVKLTVDDPIHVISGAQVSSGEIPAGLHRTVAAGVGGVDAVVVLVTTGEATDRNPMRRGITALHPDLPVPRREAVFNMAVC